MNIKFCYLYRDGANYKNFNEIVFFNPNALSPDKVNEVIRKHLIDDLWFDSKDWGLPDLHFKEYARDSEIDHDWHEFERIEETIHNATEKSSIEDFLFLVSETKLPW